MNGKAAPGPGTGPIDSDWVRLLDAERRLEAEIAAAIVEARTRVEEVRATTASVEPDPDAMAALAATEEQADIEEHQRELAQIAEAADAAVRRLTGVPDSLVEALAQFALNAVLRDSIPAERP